MSTFNPNELILERIRAVEEYDPATSELTGRYTQIEDPSLKVTAESMEIADALGCTIAEFFKSQKGEFSFSNSLFSLDLAASQFGTQKQLASDSSKIIVPVTETITIGSDATATLKYMPVGTIKDVKIINDNNTFGETYTLTATTPNIGEYSVDAMNKTLTFIDGTTGRVFVRYDKESSAAVKITKSTNDMPQVKSLLIHAIFHDPCNTNLVYAGVISCPRAQIDPSSVELSLKSDGKHSAMYKLQKPYCDESATLFDIIVSNDNA